MGEITTNLKDYRIHAVEVFKCYSPDKNLATAAQHHMSDHNFNLHILLSYGSVIGTRIQHSGYTLLGNEFYSIISS
jgi:hypothetical protein